MARIRTIKPEIWQDEDLAEVSESALILAVGLLNHADDEGYFKANIGLVKAAVYPLREPSVSIHEQLSELSNIGYLRLFTGSDGKKYGQIKNFIKHQRINRPTESKIKELDKLTEDSVSGQGGLTPGKEQGKEQGKDLTGYSPEDTGKKKTGKRANPYTQEFEQAWSAYPKRAGNNPKADAFKAWQARLKDGETPDALAEGVSRYAAYIAATGKAGTEYVMQGARFFGPSKPYEQDWTPPATQQEETWQAKAKRLGIQPKPGESEWQWKSRVEAA